MAAERFASLEQLPLQCYHKRLVDEIRAIVGNAAEAQDVVQDAWLRLLESIPDDGSLPGGSRAEDQAREGTEGDAPDNRVYLWLRCVARRLAANARRNRGRWRERLLDFHHEPAVPADSCEVIVLKDEWDHAQRVLQRLPHRQAQLLRMSSEDRSYREMAAAIGVADTSMGFRIVRARSAFAAMKRKMDREPHRDVVRASAGDGADAASGIRHFPARNGHAPAGNRPRRRKGPAPLRSGGQTLLPVPARAGRRVVVVRPESPW